MAIGKLKAEQMAQIVGGIAEGCKQANCSLIGGEIAEHPGVMPADDYDLSGFCVGVVDRPKMIGPELVEEGDVILGLASTGIHSNGFSLVRRAVTERMSLEELTAPCDKLGGTSVMDALLAPTRIYVKSIVNLLKKGLPVHAVAHITGGGITENLDRALPKTLDAQVELGSWPVLPIIQYVIDAAGLDQEQALKTFNMGIGMCVICKPQDAAAIRAELEATGETVYTVGTVIAGEGKVVYK